MLNAIKETLASYSDFPKPGISFIDIMPALADPKAFRLVIDDFVNRYKDRDIGAIVGIESRGFLLGAPIAYALNLPFIPARKKGKLPGKVIDIEYAKEYGVDHIEFQYEYIAKQNNVVVIDDLIATGGTMLAALTLLKRLEVSVAEVAAIVEITELAKNVDFGVPVYTQISA